MTCPILEFYFEVEVKKGTTHQRADHLSHIALGESLVGVNDHLHDATLLCLEWAPRWSEKQIVSS